MRYKPVGDVAPVCYDSGHQPKYCGAVISPE